MAIFHEIKNENGDIPKKTRKMRTAIFPHKV